LMFLLVVLVLKYKIVDDVEAVDARVAVEWFESWIVAFSSPSNVPKITNTRKDPIDSTRRRSLPKSYECCCFVAYNAAVDVSAHSFSIKFYNCRCCCRWWYTCCRRVIRKLNRCLSSHGNVLKFKEFQKRTNRLYKTTIASKIIRMLLLCCL
jgi:hypothetical protein